jgi:hypothetical protein
MSRVAGRVWLGSAAATSLLIGVAALLWFGGPAVLSPFSRTPLLPRGIRAAEAELRRTKRMGSVLRKGARVLHGIASKLELGSSNVIETTASSLEERAWRNELIAAVDLQIFQRGWSRGEQSPNWPKDPYRVKVSSADRERSLELLSQSRAFPATQSGTAALALSLAAGEEDESEPPPGTRSRNEALFDDSSLRLSIGKRESNMIRTLGVAEPPGRVMNRVPEGSSNASSTGSGDLR